ncbi:hypothetical protein VOLCADRAFT_102626 [Volvox carteri f. nagariensis]|uniref:Peptidase C1A papain C-terminal domain-containing protein n=1 Tax=Volvox carteri f. nagariensis TaxID=3068 RepID=D8TH47_VOLCA|nr:uncharacterized protein VOLCADRAFT_102626 [Volvox carteri f. nagariensis]EFJ53007.1 hypothetical protein VOLCADRAFT_102626 [Volvox carteri f. nagariensis]|eukprot:XP_002946012.1 hypothetical protein VOLCADRAFT_102626 [Volvox carteri f. nagariensis]
MAPAGNKQTWWKPCFSLAGCMPAETDAGRIYHRDKPGVHVLAAATNGDKREAPTNAHTSSMDVRQFKLNWKPQPEAELAQYPRLKLITADLPSETLLPPSKDLAQDWPVKRNQYDVGACVAFASTAAMEYVVRTHRIIPIELSPRFVYYCARVAIDHNTPDEDTGTYTSSAMAALKKFGAAPEELCRYGTCGGHVQNSEEPSQAAFLAGLDIQVLRAIRVGTDIRSMKVAIAAGMPVVAGFTCYENLYDEDVQSTGVIKTPKGDRIGGHCVLFVGYDDAKKLFKFRNSWGPSWGHEGYGYLPYDFAERSDGWAIAVVEDNGATVELLKRKEAAKLGLVVEKQVCVPSKHSGLVVDPTRPVAPAGGGNDTCSQSTSKYYMGAIVGQKLRLLSLSLTASEEVQGVVKDCQTGYTNTISVGIRVQKGAWAELTFTMTMRAVTCAHILEMESKLLENMSEDEKSTYKEAKQHYDGGFNVPVLSWFGVHMNAGYDKTEVEKMRNANSNYDKQAKDIAQALEQRTEQSITVSGKLSVQGVGFMPTEASAYIKVAQLKLANGKSLNVVNTDTPDGVQAADNRGTALPTTGQKLNLISVN